MTADADATCITAGILLIPLMHVIASDYPKGGP